MNEFRNPSRPFTHRQIPDRRSGEIGGKNLASANEPGARYRKEAEASNQKFLGMSAGERSALIRFLETGG